MRRILALSGPDRVSFLQGLVSNDVTRAPCWAALLSPQGKYLADFLIVPDGERLLIDLDEGVRMMAHADPALAIGARVRATAVPFGDRTVPRFVAAA